MPVSTHPVPGTHRIIEALDILYVPSRDVAADLAHYRDVLGGRVVWAIEAMGTRVAEVALAGAGPRLVLAEHLAAGEPVLHRAERIGFYEATRPAMLDGFAGRMDFT